MLFVGDDWAEDHHDVEIVDDDGRVTISLRAEITVVRHACGGRTAGRSC